jgi:hypothetical protein
MKYLIPLLFLVSCYSPQKAVKQSYKAITKRPTAVLPLFRSLFPCIETSSDTVYQVKDSVIIVKCPDPSVIEHFKTDTITNEIEYTKYIGVPVKVKLPSKTITIKVQDSAKIKELTLVINGYEKAIQGQAEDIQKLEKKVSKRNKFILWLLVALLLSGILNFILIKK